SLSGEGNPQIAPGCNFPSSVYVHERVEFISFEDQSSAVINYNDDSYRTFVKSYAKAGSPIQVRGNTIDAKGGVGKVYCIVGGSDYFAIDPTDGTITLKKDAETYVSETGRYSCELVIRAYDSRFTDGTSGGVYVDDAEVTISISNWFVNRMHVNNRASATTNDGSSLIDLAKDIGLNPSQYRDWLTYNGVTKVELFSGAVVSVDNIPISAPLATLTAPFSVPNTILAAWFGELNNIGKSAVGWNSDLDSLKLLGFHVVEFDNDGYASSTSDVAKSAFLGNIQDLADSKSLHGLYMWGHGNEVVVGSDGTNLSTTGPLWSVRYTSSADDNVSIEANLQYQLGALIVHACESNNDNARSLVVSSELGGIFWGANGLFIPIVQDGDTVAKKWGSVYLGTNWVTSESEYLIGGLQKTLNFKGK
ncbi:MAG: cadherin repeat domain-containing protein, partial [Thermoguttaceae bacterium]